MLNEPTRNPTISFGPFRLLAEQRLLLEEDQRVHLGARAMDILIALVGRPGEVISKWELMATVWPGANVLEANVNVNINALRRQLGDGQAGRRYIENIPGRGYAFVGEVDASDDTNASRRKVAAANNLPSRLTRLIGRGRVVDGLVRQLQAQRMATIVGPGGIGKTAVALAVADARLGAHRDGVWLVDLAPVTEPRLVPTALAAVLKLDIRSDDPLPRLAATLRDRNMLLVLDNCEHVIDAAAALASTLLQEAPGTQILATSREPLRVEGELLHQLQPLRCPPTAAGVSAAEALEFPAVQLFVERAAASLNVFELTDADAPIAADICRQLDGIALAIEFAAARVGALGFRGVAARLDDRLRLLTAGRRSALARHQTISAVLDWSYDLLSEREQVVLRRLAVFAGGFTLEAANAIVGGVGQILGEVGAHVLELVAKSLVTADLFDSETRLRLLETTRAYALAKVLESGEWEPLRRQHAQYYCVWLEGAARVQSATTGPSVTPAIEIDNVRAALSWAFSPSGDPSLGTALAAASAPMWLTVSLLAECRAWMEKALNSLSADDQGTPQELVIRLALANAQMFTTGMTPKGYQAWSEANDLAASLGDNERQLDSLLVMWAHQIRIPQYREARALAERCGSLASETGEVGPSAMADWMLGVTKHHLGMHAGAKAHFLRSLERDTSEARHAQMVRYGVDRRVAVLSILANLLWLQGYPEQALLMSSAAVTEAGAIEHALPICGALLWKGLNILLMGGDPDEAEACAAELLERAEKHSLSSAVAEGMGLKGVCSVRRGEFEIGARLLATGLAGLASSNYEVFRPLFMSELAKALAAAGRLDDGLEVLNELERSERNAEHWCLPEVLRSRAQLVQARSAAGDPAAERLFRRSMDVAQRQGALSWELRSVTSLGGLLLAQKRRSEARERLTSVYARFTEGFETADLRAARRLLIDLG